jgi:nitrite reductase/ring-hydroxylating ferredoxin subunit
MHGWSFDLRDGRPYPPLLRPYLVTYPVKVEEESIKISLE